MNQKEIQLFSDKKIPNEDNQYREKRNQLLKLEYELRQKVEQVAKFRRNLPEGGILKENYEFEYINNENQLKVVKFSDLFEKNKNSLFLYNFMFSKNSKTPCDMCTTVLDAWNGQAEHLQQKINFYIVSNQTPKILKEFSDKRGWNKLKILSWNKNNFGQDYHCQSQKTGNQLPVAHVFQKNESNSNIHHFWMSELLFSQLNDEFEPRHIDMAWPLWNILDFTPEGRGNQFPTVKFE